MFIIIYYYVYTDRDGPKRLEKSVLNKPLKAQRFEACVKRRSSCSMPYRDVEPYAFIMLREKAPLV